MKNFNDPFNETEEVLIETPEQKKARFKRESKERLQEDLERYQMATGRNLKFVRKREISC